MSHQHQLPVWKATGDSKKRLNQNVLSFAVSNVSDGQDPEQSLFSRRRFSIAESGMINTADFSPGPPKLPLKERLVMIGDRNLDSDMPHLPDLPSAGHPS